MSSSINIPKGIRTLQEDAPVESKYFNIAGTPYINTAQVLSEIPIGIRHKGLTVAVADGSSIKEYWFKDSKANEDLIVKDLLGNLTLSGSNTGDETALTIITKIGNGTVIDSQYLPSYVDDVLEFANRAAFPSPGETGKIYIALNTDIEYRWTGSDYRAITNGFIASTNDVSEGSNNKYFTTERVLSTLLTGISFLTGTAVIATDSVLIAFGKLQKQINDVILKLFWDGTGTDIQNNNVGNIKLKVNSTKKIIILNSSNNTVGTIDENGTFISKSSSKGFMGQDEGSGMTFDNSNLVFRCYGDSGYRFYPEYTSWNSRGGSTTATFDIIGFSNQNIAPTSGSIITNMMNFSPTINQTGGANGITRAIYINPNLQAAFDFRALEIVAGKVKLPSTTEIGNVSSTELGYLDGVLSPIQTQLDNKLTGNTSTNNYLPKVSGPKTFANSRIVDTGICIGIEAVNNPLKDITLNYQGNREIGIEDSESTVIGRDLTISGGRAIDFVISPLLVDTGASYGITSLFSDYSGNVYLSKFSGGLFKQTGGVGVFTAVPNSGPAPTIGGCVAPNGDTYICTQAGGALPGNIYKQPNGSSTFTLVSGTLGNWKSMCATPNGDVYASIGTNPSNWGGGIGDIYKQAAGTTGFVAMGFPARGYSICASPNGDVFAAVNSGSIYKISNGTTVLTDLLQTIRLYQAISTNGTDVFAVVTNGDVYKQTNNTGSFQPTGQVSRQYNAVLITTDSVLYASGYNVNLFTVNLNALGISNLQGGTLKLKAGTGKGTGISEIEMYTGQVLSSGTNMQTPTLRAKINNLGVMTLPSITNTLIEAETTGKAVATKEYVNNRLVSEKSGNYTLQSSDSGTTFIFTASATCTIPTGLVDGFECTFVTLAAVSVLFSYAGNTLHNNTSDTLLPKSNFKLKRRIVTNSFITIGNL